MSSSLNQSMRVSVVAVHVQSSSSLVRASVGPGGHKRCVRGQLYVH